MIVVTDWKLKISTYSALAKYICINVSKVSRKLEKKISGKWNVLANKNT